MSKKLPIAARITPELHSGVTRFCSMSALATFSDAIVALLEHGLHHVEREQGVSLNGYKSASLSSERVGPILSPSRAQDPTHVLDRLDQLIAMQRKASGVILGALVRPEHREEVTAYLDTVFFGVNPGEDLNPDDEETPF